MTLHSKISGLYAITPDCEETSILLQKASAVLRGGVQIVQYRNKTAPPQQRREQCHALAALTSFHGAILIVNDDPELAAEVGANGVHLGRDDPSINRARRHLGTKRLVGVSCYAELERARQAAAEGADYVAFGSFFQSSTKPGAERAPIKLLRDAKIVLGIPIVAIGGISCDNARQLIEAGADCIAMSSALFGVADIEAQVRRAAALFAVSNHGTAV